jgi:hypothetical protein
MQYGSQNGKDLEALLLDSVCLNKSSQKTKKSAHNSSYKDDPAIESFNSVNILIKLAE